MGSLFKELHENIFDGELLTHVPRNVFLAKTDRYKGMNIYSRAYEVVQNIKVIY